MRCAISTILAASAVWCGGGLQAADTWSSVTRRGQTANANAGYRADHGQARTQAESGPRPRGWAFAVGHDEDGRSAISYCFMDRDGSVSSFARAFHTPEDRRRSASSPVSLDDRVEALYTLGKGDALLDMGLYDAAVREYSRSIKLDPSHAETYYMRGIARGKRGDDSQATRDFTDGYRRLRR